MDTPSKIAYTAHATSTGGRDGHRAAKRSDGQSDGGGVPRGRVEAARQRRCIDVATRRQLDHGRAHF